MLSLFVDWCDIQLAEKDKTEITTGLGRRMREEIYIYIKWDQTGSPEIPDRRETEIPQHPFGL